MTRRPAVAGTFYPARAEQLTATVDALLADARPSDRSPAPAAVVVPHAGHVCSGPTAATAYARIDRTARTVAIFGPPHRDPMRGLAVPREAAWITPLGEVEVDRELCRRLADAGHAVVDDRPHRHEHSIEVQLPFLQRLLEPGWTLVPIAVGAGSPSLVADCMDALSESGEIPLVASTDLSHYHDEETANRLDQRTCEAVVARDWAAIGYDDACGADALRGLLAWTVRHDLPVRLLDRTTSAATCSDPSRVVGYAAFEVQRP